MRTLFMFLGMVLGMWFVHIIGYPDIWERICFGALTVFIFAASLAD